jgi:hypothetical protein
MLCLRQTSYARTTADSTVDGWRPLVPAEIPDISGGVGYEDQRTKTRPKMVLDR